MPAVARGGFHSNGNEADSRSHRRAVELIGQFSFRLGRRDFRSEGGV